MFQQFNKNLPFTVAIVNGVLTGLLLLFFEKDQMNWFYLTLGIVLAIVIVEVSTTYKVGSHVGQGNISSSYNKYLGALLGLSLAILLAFLGIYLVQEFIPLFYIEFGYQTSTNQIDNNTIQTIIKSWLEPKSIILTLVSFLAHYLIPLVLANLGAWLGIRTVIEHVTINTFRKGVSYTALAFPLFFCGSLIIWNLGQWIVLDSISLNTNYFWAISVSLLAVGIQFDFLKER